MPVNVLLPLDREAVRQAARELKDAGVEFDRGLLPVLVHESGARGDNARDHPGGIPRASRCRCRAKCCRASANGRGSRPRCSTRISSRCWCATSTTSIAGSTMRSVGTQQRFLMQSNGGVMPFSAAIGGGRTVHTLFSGPAAGAQASAYLAEDDARTRPRHPRHGRHLRRHRLHRRRRAAGDHRER